MNPLPPPVPGHMLQHLFWALNEVVRNLIRALVEYEHSNSNFNKLKPFDLTSLNWCRFLTDADVEAATQGSGGFQMFWERSSP